MTDKEFNLVDEEWIPVIYLDGTSAFVSLRTAFEDADKIRTLSGDVPPQDAVLFRLMLAILYCIYSRRDEDGRERGILDLDDALGRWKGLWDRGRFDIRTVDGYLESVRDRFYLFHPELPFYQVNIDRGTEYTAAKLNGCLSESSNKPRLFSNVSGECKQGMSYAEAARWLLYVNAFDDTSSKPTRKGENMPSPGAGWVGKLGFVMILGGNLFETLMLNLVLADEHNMPFPDGKAAWEIEKPRTDERVEVPLPGSPQEILTLQDRRLLLRRDGGRVVGYLLLGGDVVSKENALIEQMTMWVMSKDGKWIPRRHDPSRAMWRDFSSILMRSGNSQSMIHEPGVTRWVATLVDEGLVDFGMVNVRATGVKYGDKDFFVDDLIDDSITVNSSILMSMNESLNNRIDRTVVKTEECVRILGRLAYDIADLNGLDDNRKRIESDKAHTFGYMRLDQPFRRWLASVGSAGSDIETAFNHWDSIMERILLDAGRELIDVAGTRALIGGIDEKGRIRNGFTVFRTFRIRLHEKIKGEEQ